MIGSMIVGFLIGLIALLYQIGVNVRAVLATFCWMARCFCWSASFLKIGDSIADTAIVPSVLGAVIFISP